MVKAEKELLRLMEKVQMVSQKMDELEYDKNTSRRMRNVILREFGKKVEDLKVDPFEVMLQKVEKSATENVRRNLSNELTESFEYLIIELIKDFRKEFSAKREASKKEDLKVIERVKKDITQMNNILEKKVAIMEEDMFKKTSELEDKNDEITGTVKKIIKKLQARLNTLDSNLSSDEDKMNEMGDDLREVNKWSDKTEKKINLIDNLSKGLKTEIRSLKATNRTLLEKDISHIWKEIESVKKEIKDNSLEKQVKNLRKEIETVKKLASADTLEKEVKQMKDDIEDLWQVTNGDMEKEITSLRKDLDKLINQFEIKPTKMVDKIEKLEEQMKPIKSKKIVKGLERIDALERMVMEALKPKKERKN